MDIHDRKGSGFIEKMQGTGVGKAFSNIKEAFSNIKLPSTADVKQEIENAQIISKQVSGKLTLKMLGMLSVPGAREKMLDRLEKMESGKEIIEEKALKGKMQAEKVEIRARKIELKWGLTLMSLGKHLGYCGKAYGKRTH